MNKQSLLQKIKTIDGLTNQERSELIELSMQTVEIMDGLPEVRFE